MDLILWRHAEAFALRDDEDDLERALTPKGERQAKRVAEWLDGVLPDSTRILVSPARRAQQTARALDRKFKTCDALKPDGSAEALLEAARWPDSKEPVLVVGHQPALGLTASTLLAGVAQPWTIRKGGVWWLRRANGVQPPRIVVVAVRAPEKP